MEGREHRRLHHRPRRGIYKSQCRQSRKQLSTGIKAYDDYGRKINKRKADEKAKEIVAKYDGISHLTVISDI